ncbi:MAG: DUF3078 domain-containing protein [Alistipes sp.]|nr:DUF3078 domain-containing protein [Alistipes sp.]
MKKFFTLLTLLTLFALASTGIANAQATVESATPQEQVTFANQVKTEKDAPAFKSEAQIKAEKLALRKERNTVEFNATLNGSLAHFNDKWLKVNGNTNSLTGIGNILFTHTYTKGKFTIGSKVTGKLGYAYNFTNNESESTISKSQDEWFIQTSPAYVISKQWNVGGSLSLRSQFANGWDSSDKESRKLTSSGFAPAYLIASIGVTYVCPNAKFPIKINIAPISMNATYVTNESVRNFYYADKFGTTPLAEADKNTPYVYGLTLANNNQRYEGGSSIQLDFDKTFGKKGVFRYRTTLYSFYGWINEVAQQNDSKKSGIVYESIAPTVRWENTIDIKATKYFSTQFYFQLYYNKAQIKQVQTQVVLGVGLAYTFKNK